MPTYEYACTACGHHVEVVQSFTDDPLTTCPECGASLRKVFGSIGIVLKGSGFYKNDSRPQAAKDSGKDKSGSGAADGSKGGSATKKPATESSSSSDTAGSSGSSGGSIGSDTSGAGKPKAAAAT